MANNEKHIEAKPEGVAVFIKGKSSEDARLVISEADLEAQKPSSAVDDAAQLKAERDHDRGVSSPDAPREIAVFDFDGSCISGNSPVLLVRYLLKKGQVRTSVLLRILTWGIAYKLHLPQNEAWVRSLVFSSFDGMPEEEADAEMYKFYDEWIVPRIRPKALQVMREHIAAGRDIWIVSATFDPIIVRAKRDIPYDHHVATDMKLDEHGCYTREVKGKPVEGAEKLRQIKEHADQIYGKDSWKLAYAYGDHYSDAPLLAASEHPAAVTPGPTLQHHAEKEGWQVLDWR